jgi:cysteine-rich repeat protein
VTLVDPTRRTGYWTNGTNGNGCSGLCLNEGSDSVFESICGNSRIETGEDCDDGNTRSFDGCSKICLNEGTATCGDGLVTHSEECDTNAEPWLSDPGFCQAGTCLLLGSDSCSSIAGTNCCGNGVLENGEVCDDSDDPGCRVPPVCDDSDDPGCRGPALGSGINPGTPLTGFCLRTGNILCGDGIIEPGKGETCDDRNSDPGDGCSSICLKEGATCGNGGNLDIGEDCDSGIGCAFDCTHEGNPTATCGDENALSSEGEDCDLGPLSNEAYIFVNHTPFAPETNYGVRIGSGIKDAFQNCFLPCADANQGDAGGHFCARVPNAGSQIGWAEGVPWSALATFPTCELP